MMTRRGFLTALGLGCAALPLRRTLGALAPEVRRPKNIILILADDLGWGDVSCYGSTPNLTPFIDEWAKGGVRFTDAHSPASTCTPTRYAILTGEYAWRRPGTGIARGDAAPIIAADKMTFPKLLQRAGMTTGAVGKWHLGMGLGPGKTDWNKQISPSANDVGFDYTFLMAATADRTPCVYVEDGLVVNADPEDPIEVNYDRNYPGEPDGVRDRASLKMNWSHGHNQAVVNGIGRIGYMKGGKKARWVDEEMGDIFVEKACAFIERQKASPFFLYFATNDIHVPRVPHPRFVGLTGMGPRGDATRQFDDCVRRVVEKVRELGLEEETLIVLTSDNGPVLDDGYQDQAVQLAKQHGHKIAGDWRGGKYTPYEGGHRLPFIAVWKDTIPAGQTSSALVSLADLGATFAALVGEPLPSKALSDSFDQSAALLDPAHPSARESLICQDYHLNIRTKDWKYIVPNAARNAPNPNHDPRKGQLYDLRKDPAERTNVINAHQELAQQLFTTLIEARRNGATRPAF